MFMWVVSVRELFTGAVFPTYLLFRHMMLLPVICLTLCVLTREIKAAPQRADKHPTPVVLVPGMLPKLLFKISSGTFIIKFRSCVKISKLTSRYKLSL